jgi:hypothetical protein
MQGSRRSADDFTAIRARMEELKRERDQAARRGKDEPSASYGQRVSRSPAPAEEPGRGLFRGPRLS